jgi:hypothetical protein
LKTVTRSTYRTHEKYRLEDIASSGTQSSGFQVVNPPHSRSRSPSSQQNDLSDLVSDTSLHEIVHDSSHAPDLQQIFDRVSATNHSLVCTSANKLILH